MARSQTWRAGIRSMESDPRWGLPPSLCLWPAAEQHTPLTPEPPGEMLRCSQEDACPVLIRLRMQGRKGVVRTSSSPCSHPCAVAGEWRDPGQPEATQQKPTSNQPQQRTKANLLERYRNLRLQWKIHNHVRSLHSYMEGDVNQPSAWVP